MIKWMRTSILSLLLLSIGLAQAETTIYYHTDALGSPVAATDAQGNILWRENYAPYGDRLLEQDGGTEATWYTGKQHDEDVGLSYFGARWYDPVHGRFMAMDPVDFQHDNIQSFNKYAYANNNPYKYVDPDGRQADWIFNNPFNPYELTEGAGGAGFRAYNPATKNRSLAESKGVGSSAKPVDSMGLTDPSKIRFSQDSIKGTFRDGRSVSDLAKGLRDGSIKPSDVPAIRTVERNGQLISIDNRRLAAFREAGVSIRTRPATAAEIAQAQKQGKFSAGPSGSDTIHIRGQ